MEHAILDIYVNESGKPSTNGGKQQEHSARDITGKKGENGVANTQGIFKRPRTRSSSNGMDILANIKNSIGDGAYSSVYNYTIQHYKGKGNVTEVARTRGRHAEYNARAGIALAAFAAREVVTTSFDLLGTFTTNTAKQNQLDNQAAAINGALGAIGSVGAGYAAGGWIGALVALAMTAVKQGATMIKRSFENDKNNKMKALDSERKSNRLGYIEAGYSR